VGPSAGEPTPLSAGLDGMDLVVSPPRRFCERNLDLFEGLTAPRRPGAGKLPSLIYFVLFHVNFCTLSPENTTHVLPCFFAFSSARELCKAARAASAPAVSEVAGVAVVVFAFVELFAAFRLNFVGSNLTPRLPSHLVLTLGSTLVTLFGLGLEPEVVPPYGMSGEFEEDEFVELVLRKRSYVKGS
jgi:hypothetical protein